MLKVLGLLAAVVLLCAISAPPASANTIYTYTGNRFTSFAGYTCPPVCKITGSFTVASPFAANLSNFSVTPLSYSFTDGSLTLTNNNSSILSGVFPLFSTDASGRITNWDVEVILTGLSPHKLKTANAFFTSGGVFSDLTCNSQPNCSAATLFAQNFNMPGTWSSGTPVTIPEPGSLLLLGTGLLGVWGAARRNLRG